MRLPGPLIAIVGPTASGKSSLAERVACELASSVVSIDAMQVYKGMDIGTAKTPLEARRCPLLMVDVVDVGEPYSVQRFQHDARTVIDELLKVAKTPVLCGGTGLYLNAVIDEMHFPAGTTGGAARTRYEALATAEGTDAVYDLLRTRDPQSAALIHPHNLRRVIRALEMLDGGLSYAQQHQGLAQRAAHYTCAIWGIKRDREQLYRRIAQRVRTMFDDGLIDEVQSLCAEGLRGALTSRQAIGYAQVLAYLEGSCTLEDAYDDIVKRTCHYAKRQISWFTHDSRVQWLDFETMGEVEAVSTILQNFKRRCDHLARKRDDFNERHDAQEAQ